MHYWTFFVIFHAIVAFCQLSGSNRGATDGRVLYTLAAFSLFLKFVYRLPLFSLLFPFLLISLSLLLKQDLGCQAPEFFFEILHGWYYIELPTRLVTMMTK